MQNVSFEIRINDLLLSDATRTNTWRWCVTFKKPIQYMPTENSIASLN